MSGFTRAFKMLPTWMQIGAILFTAAMIMAGLEGIGLVKATPAPVEAATASTVPETANTANIHLGDVCIVSESCYGAVSEDAFKAVTRAATAKDSEGISELIATGLVAPIQAGTKARLLEHGVFKRKVRLLSGDFDKEAVYVPAEFVTAP